MTPKLKYGIGINDAEYPTQSSSGVCPYYSRWSNMLKRCYCTSDIERNPSYSDCYVCKEWLTFSKFKEWMKKQDWHNKELDKDLLVAGNKAYSPDSCIFVSQEINKLLITNSHKRGEHPIGVVFCRQIKRFKAGCKVNGVRKHIGCFDSAELAHIAYKKFKYEIIAKVAKRQSEPLKSALLNYRIGG